MSAAIERTSLSDLTLHSPPTLAQWYFVVCFGDTGPEISVLEDPPMHEYAVKSINLAFLSQARGMFDDFVTGLPRCDWMKTSMKLLRLCML